MRSLRSELEKLKEDFDIASNQIVKSLKELISKIEFPLDPDYDPSYGFIDSVLRKLKIIEKTSEGTTIERTYYNVTEAYRWAIVDGKIMIRVHGDIFYSTIRGFLPFEKFIEYLRKGNEYRDLELKIPGVVYEKLYPVSRATFYRIISKASESLPIYLRYAIEYCKSKRAELDEKLKKLEAMLKSI